MDKLIAISLIFKELSETGQSAISKQKHGKDWTVLHDICLKAVKDAGYVAKSQDLKRDENDIYEITIKLSEFWNK